MKQFMFFLAAAICAVTVSGCVSSKDISAKMNKAAEVDGVVANDIRIIRNKTTNKEILEAIGAPSLVFKNADKTETWVYSRIGVRRTNAGFIAKGNFAALFPYEAHSLSKGGGLAGVSADAQLASSRSAYKSAALLINYNSKGCVNTFEFTTTSF